MTLRQYNRLKQLNPFRQLLVSSVLLAPLVLAGCGGNSGQKWTGTWEFVDPSSQETVQFILSDDNKVFVVPPESVDSSTVYEIPIEKVSGDTTLPEGADIINLAEAAQQQQQAAMESQAKTYVGAMARAQQAYFIENNAFASTIEDLGIGIESETPQYQYAIEVQDNGNAVKITATAKQSDLPSYTGAVFATDNTPVAGGCQTDEASQMPPEMPELSGDNQFQCPSGSSSLQ